MLDIRYFCAKSVANSSLDNQLVGYQPHESQSTVVKPSVTSLPAPVATLLKELHIGGVILFSENLIDEPQISQLTSDIQACCVDNSLPMFISVDQEGGRVARLPRDNWPAFTGNMSIGALKDKRDSEASYDVGKAIGQQLFSLGINVNHAPTVDVNINHQNPVINVRSFGDNAQRVSNLGQEMGRGMMSAGIIPTFKHFPGHGDTFVDSHTGLPSVNHDIDTVHNVDLLPFKQAIDNDVASMIMTAHIQYPALDSTTLMTKNGETLIRPATLSKSILTELLRNELCYNGVVITDALDMASISKYFTPASAIIETFKAGSDIALMPFKIHTIGGIEAFYQLFDEVVAVIENDSELCEQVLQSFDRVKCLKASFGSRSQTKSLGAQTIAQHRQLEREIALGSLVKLSHSNPIDFIKFDKICLVFPSKEQANALHTELTNTSPGITKYLSFHCADYKDLNAITDITSATLLVLGVEDKKSAVVLGGVDDLTQESKDAVSQEGTVDIAQNLLSEHEIRGGESVFISLKAPYHLSDYIKLATYSFASFDGSTYKNIDDEETGPAFWALAQVLLNKNEAIGKLPITP